MGLFGISCPETYKVPGVDDTSLSHIDGPWIFASLKMETRIFSGICSKSSVRRGTNKNRSSRHSFRLYSALPIVVSPAVADSRSFSSPYACPLKVKKNPICSGFSEGSFTINSSSHSFVISAVFPRRFA